MLLRDRPGREAVGQRLLLAQREPTAIDAVGDDAEAAPVFAALREVLDQAGVLQQRGDKGHDLFLALQRETQRRNRLPAALAEAVLRKVAPHLLQRALRARRLVDGQKVPEDVQHGAEEQGEDQQIEQKARQKARPAAFFPFSHPGSPLPSGQESWWGYAGCRRWSPAR